MKTKHYEFTKDEVMTLKEALIEYYQMIRTLKPVSPIFIKNQKNAVALKEQFVSDYSLWK